MEELKRQLRQLINKNKPKVSQGDSRNGYQSLKIEKRNSSFELPIKEGTIAISTSRI